MRRALLLLAAALVSGCASLGAPRGADRYFVLAPEGGGPATPASADVAVAPMSAANFYDSQDIVFSRSAGTRGHYQFSRWTERPQTALHGMLGARLRGSVAAGAPVLATHIEEIYHDAGLAPGVARLRVSARLIDPASRAVLAERRFSAAAPAPSHDAAGAVAGLRQASASLLDELVAWVVEQRRSAAAATRRD
jgi:cholesterol transport system auxiliary component